MRRKTTPSSFTFYLGQVATGVSPNRDLHAFYAHQIVAAPRAN
jgi:hypothetical protein